MSALPTLLILMLCYLQLACASHEASEQGKKNRSQQVRIGMTEKEVVKAIGEPMGLTAELTSEGRILVYDYGGHDPHDEFGDRGGVKKVHFMNGLVTLVTKS